MSSSRRFSAIAAAAGFLVLVLLFTYADCGTIQKRAIEESNTQEANKPSYCHRSTPCGWAIYVPFTREIVHFMPNTCKCQEGLGCVRTEDDYSVSAYVHRCRARPKKPESESYIQNNNSP